MEENAVSDYTLRYVGDQALLVEFENEISIEVNQKVRALKYDLEQRTIPGIGELVPTYRALLIHYDSLRADLDQLKETIQASAASLDLSHLPRATVTEIPVLYEGEYALDLEEIARLENTTPDQNIHKLIDIHYILYKRGCAPVHPDTARDGHPFSFKRRESPRVRIPGGSIVVQLALSDIIPFDQPCGWNIIGTTPILACDYRKENPFLLKAGQWIRHVPVDQAEFMEIKRQVELGEYQCRTYERGT